MFEALAKRFKHVLSNIVKHPNARSCGPRNYPEYHNNFNIAVILIELLEEDEKKRKRTRDD